MIQDDLRKKRGPDLGEAVESLTREVREAKRNENRLKILMDVNGIGLAMASAILTVLYPDYFTVYDTRVCTQLGRFADLGSRPNSEIWDGYEEFRRAVREEAVRKGAPESLRLRDMDRWLWTVDVVEQLKSEGCNPPAGI